MSDDEIEFVDFDQELQNETFIMDPKQNQTLLIVKQLFRKQNTLVNKKKNSDPDQGICQKELKYKIVQLQRDVQQNQIKFDEEKQDLMKVIQTQNFKLNELLVISEKDSKTILSLSELSDQTKKTFTREINQQNSIIKEFNNQINDQAEAIQNQVKISQDKQLKIETDGKIIQSLTSQNQQLLKTLDQTSHLNGQQQEIMLVNNDLNSKLSQSLQQLSKSQKEIKDQGLIIENHVKIIQDLQGKFDKGNQTNKLLTESKEQLEKTLNVSTAQIGQMKQQNKDQAQIIQTHVKNLQDLQGLQEKSNSTNKSLMVQNEQLQKTSNVSAQQTQQLKEENKEQVSMILKHVKTIQDLQGKFDKSNQINQLLTESKEQLQKGLTVSTQQMFQQKEENQEQTIIIQKYVKNIQDLQVKFEKIDQTNKLLIGQIELLEKKVQLPSQRQMKDCPEKFYPSNQFLTQQIKPRQSHIKEEIKQMPPLLNQNQFRFLPGCQDTNGH